MISKLFVSLSRTHRNDHVSLYEEVLPAEPGAVRPSDVIHITTPGVDKQFEMREYRARVEAFCERRCPREKDIVIDFLFEGCSVEDIARQDGLDPQVVSATIKEVLMELRAFLDGKLAVLSAGGTSAPIN